VLEEQVGVLARRGQRLLRVGEQRVPDRADAHRRERGRRAVTDDVREHERRRRARRKRSGEMRGRVRRL
jgi:hypothetical protein